MSNGEPTQRRSDEYEKAYVTFLREGSKWNEQFDSWTDFKASFHDEANDIMSQANELLALAANEGRDARSEAKEAVSAYTSMNKNDAEARMNETEAQAVLDRLTFESITKLTPHDPDRDPMYLLSMDYEDESKMVRCEAGTLLNPGRFAERFFIEFDKPETFPKKNDWREFLEDAFERMKVDVETEDPTKPEHVVAESVVGRLTQCDVTVDVEEFRKNTGQSVFYDEDREAALVAADMVDTARGKLHETASADAVVSVLQERGLVPEAGAVVRPWGEGYFRVWEFTPSALIEQGVIEARVFEDPSTGRDGAVVA